MIRIHTTRALTHVQFPPLTSPLIYCLIVPYILPTKRRNFQLLLPHRFLRGFFSMYHILFIYWHTHQHNLIGETSAHRYTHYITSSVSSPAAAAVAVEASFSSSSAPLVNWFNGRDSYSYNNHSTTTQLCRSTISAEWT